jgi:hypothetical protein
MGKACQVLAGHGPPRYRESGAKGRRLDEGRGGRPEHLLLHRRELSPLTLLRSRLPISSSRTRPYSERHRLGEAMLPQNRLIGSLKFGTNGRTQRREPLGGDLGFAEQLQSRGGSPIQGNRSAL